MNLINKVFASKAQQNEAALLSYTVACDPDFDTSLKIMHEIAKNGEAAALGLHSSQLLYW